MDRALALRPALVDGDGHAGLAVEIAGIGARIAGVGEKELAVRCRQLGPGADEAVADAAAEGEDALARQRIFEDLLGEAESPGVLVQGDRLADPPVEPGGIVIAIVLADAGQRVGDLDAVGAQHSRIADAGELQQLR